MAALLGKGFTEHWNSLMVLYSMICQFETERMNTDWLMCFMNDDQNEDGEYNVD